MKGIRIIFQTIEDDRTVGLTLVREVSVISLKNSITPLLPIMAEEEARKFWESVVLMGRIES